MEITAKSMHHAGLFDNCVLHPACDKYAISIKNAFDFLYPNDKLWLHKTRPLEGDFERFWASKSKVPPQRPDPN